MADLVSIMELENPSHAPMILMHEINILVRDHRKAIADLPEYAVVRSSRLVRAPDPDWVPPKAAEVIEPPVGGDQVQVLRASEIAPVIPPEDRPPPRPMWRSATAVLNAVYSTHPKPISRADIVTFMMAGRFEKTSCSNPITDAEHKFKHIRDDGNNGFVLTERGIEEYRGYSKLKALGRGKEWRETKPR